MTAHDTMTWPIDVRILKNRQSPEIWVEDVPLDHVTICQDGQATDIYCASFWHTIDFQSPRTVVVHVATLPTPEVPFEDIGRIIGDWKRQQGDPRTYVVLETPSQRRQYQAWLIAVLR